MKLKVIVDEKAQDIDVPAGFILEAEDFFAKMDQDMDRGWRMGPEFIENPDQINRCQIAANKLLTSLSTSNAKVAMLMAGYILKRLPGVTGVRIDTGGEMLNSEFIYGPGAHAIPTPRPESRGARAVDAGSLSREDAISQAEKEVTKVFRVGNAYRFAVLDRVTGHWIESPLMTSAEEARQQRMEAFDGRFEELCGSSH